MKIDIEDSMLTGQFNCGNNSAHILSKTSFVRTKNDDKNTQNNRFQHLIEHISSMNSKYNEQYKERGLYK